VGRTDRRTDERTSKTRNSAYWEGNIKRDPLFTRRKLMTKSIEAPG